MKHKFASLLPSLADVFFFGVFIRLSLVAGQTLLGDADTGYHIRAGEFILDTFSVPKQDIFSFHSPSLPWTAHEWLSEVVMALFHRGFGLTGVVLFFSLVIASVYFLLFKALRANQGNIILAALLLALVIASSQIHWLARPHIFSLLFTVIWYYLLDAYQYREKNYLYFLPPLMLFWVNLHGGFMFGFILLGVYLIGNLGEYFLGPDVEKEKRKQKVRLLGLVTLICVLASLVNPYGYDIFLFPFKLTLNRFLMDNVGEFLSPNFHGRMPFRYLLFLAIALFALSVRRPSPIELILIILMTHMALYSARYIPLYAIISAPILLRQANHLLTQTNGPYISFFKARSNNIESADALSRGHLWPMLAILIIFFSLATGRVTYHFDKNLKPVAAVEFLRNENIPGNMFNNDEFGDYLIYAAWPKYRVFFDGRSDMYGNARIKEYLKVARVEPGWEEIVQKYDIKWIFFDARSALSTFLKERSDWHLIYSDKIAAIFVRNIPDYQPLITKYPDVQLVIGEDSGKG